MDCLCLFGFSKVCLVLCLNMRKLTGLKLSTNVTHWNGKRNVSKWLLLPVWLFWIMTTFFKFLCKSKIVMANCMTARATKCFWADNFNLLSERFLILDKLCMFNTEKSRRNGKKCAGIIDFTCNHRNDKQSKFSELNISGDVFWEKCWMKNWV